MRYIIGYDLENRNIQWTLEYSDSTPDEEMNSVVDGFTNRGFLCLWVQSETPIVASMDFYIDIDHVIQNRATMELNVVEQTVINTEEVINNVPVGTEVYIDGILQGTVDDGSLELEFSVIGSYDIRLVKKPEYHDLAFTIEVTNEN